MKPALHYTIILCSLFAVVAQYVLLLQNSPVAAAEATIRFFSYFTILTNELVAVCFTLALFRPVSAAFFTAVTVYITIVGAVYQLLLRQVWEPQGLQMLVDELLHSVVPVLVILYWILYQRSRLPFSRLFRWLLYPLVYLAYILLRGSVSGFYPYPFVDVHQLGYAKVLVNCGLLSLVFMLVSAAYIALGRRGRTERKNSGTDILKESHR